MRHWFANILPAFTAAVLLCSRPGWATPTLGDIDALIESYQMEEAEEAISQLPGDNLQSAEGQYTLGKYYFFIGKYQKAETLIRAAIQESKTELDWKYMRDQVDISSRQTEALTRTKPAHGITFYHPHGAERLLITYALKALRAQRDALKSELGDFVPDLRVYILPSVEVLSEMCGLSVEQIESTGTVAITKYNRIMILSPKLIVGGYPWMDTLAHELTHIYITRLTANRAPIWLHEGIAKLLESLWRKGPQGQLTPVSAYLLDQAAREKRLIPLRRFHPSVSYLPNQEDAALAYAQGLSFLAYISQKFKDGHSLKTFLPLVASSGVETALRETTTYEIKKLYRWWQEELVGARATPAALVPMMKRRFKTRTDERNANIDPILGKEVRRHIRVGDLLRLRGHVDAAIREYKWALEKTDALTPDIVDRLAGALLMQKNAGEALELLQPMKSLYPHHATVFIQAGEAHTELRNFKAAETELNTAISLEPFHAEVHCMLSAIFGERGDTAAAEREKKVCLELSSSSE
ncbi:MAG: tetratricopeptide repeat protein [Deltaproteobacteria bacterium]|nr:tetratricopeptide repeat protein [Deltaproteobacteria bacterium]MBN2672345.1 tetratricopeptide repeat protein [Deltaproteobacteria bacterium]